MCDGRHSLSQARAVDAKIAAGRNRLLAGIPRYQRQYVYARNSYNLRLTHAGELCAAHESTVTQLLAEAGAVMVGKTNLDEFAMGSSTENSAYQVTANPGMCHERALQEVQPQL